MTGFLLYFLLLAESLRLTLLQKLVLPELPVLLLFLLYYSRSESHRKFPALLFLGVQVLRYLPRYLEFQLLLYQLPVVGITLQRLVPLNLLDCNLQVYPTHLPVDNQLCSNVLYFLLNLLQTLSNSFYYS